MNLVTCSTNTTPCPLENQVTVTSDLVEILLTGGFDMASFELAFTGVLALWVTGLAIGIVIAQIRKVRAP